MICAKFIEGSILDNSTFMKFKYVLLVSRTKDKKFIEAFEDHPVSITCGKETVVRKRELYALKRKRKCLMLSTAIVEDGYLWYKVLKVSSAKYISRI